MPYGGWTQFREQVTKSEKSSDNRIGAGGKMAAVFLVLAVFAAAMAMLFQAGVIK